MVGRGGSGRGRRGGGIVWTLRGVVLRPRLGAEKKEEWKKKKKRKKEKTSYSPDSHNKPTIVFLIPSPIPPLRSSFSLFNSPSTKSHFFSLKNIFSSPLFVSSPKDWYQFFSKVLYKPSASSTNPQSTTPPTKLFTNTPLPTFPTGLTSPPNNSFRNSLTISLISSFPVSSLASDFNNFTNPTTPSVKRCSVRNPLDVLRRSSDL